MPHVIEFMSYKLKPGASVPDFLAASENFHKEYVSKQQGFISQKLLSDGVTWADLLVWESMEAVEKAFGAAQEDPTFHALMSFLDEMTGEHLLPVIKKY